MSEQEPPSTSDLRTLATLVREMQGDLRALGIKDAERRVTEAVAQVAESMAGRDRTLAEQSAMLIEILNRLPARP